MSNHRVGIIHTPEGDWVVRSPKGTRGAIISRTFFNEADANHAMAVAFSKAATLHFAKALYLARTEAES